MVEIRILKQFKHIIKTYANKESILVYQMGKVGSTSLENSLHSAIHLHTFYNKPPCFLRKESFRKNPRKWIENFIGNFLKRVVIKNRKKTKIISLIRDPYSRNLSMFFQDMSYWMIRHQELSHYDTREEGFQFLYETFEKSYDHFYFDKWFNEEIKKLSGIDIFNYPFDKKSGYQIIKGKNYEILLLQLERMGDLVDEISDFVGYKIEMKSTNISSNKWYAPVYESFKKNYLPTPYYIDSLYATRTAKHFYTETDLLLFKTKHLSKSSVS
jgi:hypothetical protein